MDRALAKREQDRFASAADFAVAMQAVLQGATALPPRRFREQPPAAADRGPGRPRRGGVRGRRAPIRLMRRGPARVRLTARRPSRRRPRSTARP